MLPPPRRVHAASAAALLIPRESLGLEDIAEHDERWESYRNSWEKFSGMRHVYPKLLERLESGQPVGESLELLLVQGVDEVVQVRVGEKEGRREGEGGGERGVGRQGNPFSQRYGRRCPCCCLSTAGAADAGQLCLCLGDEDDARMA